MEQGQGGSMGSQQNDSLLTTDPAMKDKLEELSEYFKTVETKFSLREAIRISQDDRLLNLGEVEFDLTPFTYGEIDFDSFADILLSLQQNYNLFPPSENPSAVFYDLGSGVGKPCITAAATLNSYLQKCVGVEYLEGLYNKSLELSAFWAESELKLRYGGSLKPQLIFLRDDFFANTTWAEEVDVLFMNATCFEPHMVQSISKILVDKLKKGSIVIMTTKSLIYSEIPGATDEEQIFKRIGPVKKKMSWGETDVNVYIKQI